MRVCLGHIEGKIPGSEDGISRGMAVGKGAVSKVWFRDSSVGGRGAGG